MFSSRWSRASLATLVCAAALFGGVKIVERRTPRSNLERVWSGLSVRPVDGRLVGFEYIPRQRAGQVSAANVLGMRAAAEEQLNRIRPSTARDTGIAALLAGRV